MKKAAELPSGEALDVFERMQRMDEVARDRDLALLSRERPDLYPQVVTLIEAHRRAEAANFLSDDPVDLLDRLLGFEAGDTVGNYRLERRLGAGGMGEVWLARRADGLYEGSVALKALHPHLAQSAVRERFAREARLLAKLQHPHIARLLDAGVTAAGQLYLALEYVEGVDLDRYCDAASLTVEQRLRLFLSVCDAVSHAHANLVVHRDLKPTNIMVSADGQAKLLDFGIAKLIESEEGDAKETELTQLSGRVLTPAYAAPEQLRGDPVTPATDIYALGVVLYRLLAGCSPYGADDLKGLELERAILESDPLPPSRAGAGLPVDQRAAIATSRSTTVPKLRRLLGGDLDTIVMTALRKAPRQRYAAVSALADDIGRFLDHRPVLARPDSVAYRTWKFALRNRTSLALGGALGLVLVASGWQVHANARDRQRELSRWSGVGSDLIAKGETGRAAVALSRAYAIDPTNPVLRVQVRQAMGSVDALLQRIRTASAPVNRVALSQDGRLLATIADRRWIEGWQVSDGRRLIRVDFGDPVLEALKPVFSPDGRYLMAHGWVREGKRSYVDIVLIDFQERRQIARLQVSSSTEMEPQHPFDPEGRFVYVDHDKMSVHVLQLPGDKDVLTLPFTARQRIASFSPDGSRILVGGEKGALSLWDAHTGAKVRAYAGMQADISALGMSEDGTRIIAGGTGVQGAPIKIWDTKTGEIQVAGGQRYTINLTRFSQDGRRYLTIADDGLRVWDSAVGSVTLAPIGAVDHHKWHALSPDGQWLAFTNLGPAALIDVRSGFRMVDFDGAAGGAFDAAFDRSGGRLATAGADGTVEVWKLPVRPLWRQELGVALRGANSGQGAYHASFSPDGERFAFSGSDGVVEVRRTADQAAVLRIAPRDDAVYSVRWSIDGRRLLVANEFGRLRLVDSRSGDEVARVDSGLVIREWLQVQLAGDASRVLICGGDLSLHPRLWDPASGALLELPLVDTEDAIRLFDDGRRVLVGRHAQVTLLDASTVKPLWVADLPGPREASVMAIVVSRDRTRVMAATDGGWLYLLDAQSGAVLRQFHFDFPSPPRWLAWSPDQRVLAVAGNSIGAYVWPLDEPAPRALPGHTSPVKGVSFSRDGQKVLTRSEDGTARVWSARDGTAIVSLGQSVAPINSAEFSPDGTRVLLTSAANVVELWDVGAETRTPQQVADRVRCTIPWRIEGDALVTVRPGGGGCPEPMRVP